MKLPQAIELIHRSSERMSEMLDVLREDRDDIWWRVLQREAWIHLKRTLRLLWLVLRRSQ